MNKTEEKADNLLLIAKGETRRAIGILDPSPAEPVAKAILRVMDAIDDAREELRKRGPGRELLSADGNVKPGTKREANG